MRALIQELTKKKVTEVHCNDMIRSFFLQVFLYRSESIEIITCIIALLFKKLCILIEPCSDLEPETVDGNSQHFIPEVIIHDFPVGKRLVIEFAGMGRDDGNIKLPGKEIIQVDDSGRI